jgi:hypothetical protein
MEMQMSAEKTGLLDALADLETKASEFATAYASFQTHMATASGAKYAAHQSTDGHGVERKLDLEHAVGMERLNRVLRLRLIELGLEGLFVTRDVRHGAGPGEAWSSHFATYINAQVP